MANEEEMTKQPTKIPRLFIEVVLLFIIIFILSAVAYFIMTSSFYEMIPHSPAQLAIGNITGQTCNSTHIIYYRNVGTFFGVRQVETTKDKADFSLERCIP